MPVHAVSEECRSWLLGHRWKLKHGAKVKKGSLFWRDPMKDEHNYYLCLTINCYKYSITRLERSEMKIIRSYLPKLNCAADHGQTHDCGLPEQNRALLSGSVWAHLRQVSYQSPRRCTCIPRCTCFGSNSFDVSVWIDVSWSVEAFLIVKSVWRRMCKYWIRTQKLKFGRWGVDIKSGMHRWLRLDNPAL